MRLLYLVPEFPSQTHSFFWREIQALRALNVEVVPLSTRRPPPDACRHAFAHEAREQTHYLFPPRWASDLLYLAARPHLVLKALGYITGLRESNWKQKMVAAQLMLPAARLCRLGQELSADHLHVHSFANSAHVAALARILGGSTYSLTLHGDLGVYGCDHASKAHLASFVTCVTDPLRQEVLSRLALPSDRVHLLWMGVDTRHFQPVEAQTRPGDGPLRLVSVARLHINKGHRFALRALKNLRDLGLKTHYTIVGDGPAKEEIRQEVVTLGLTDTVEIVGTRSESEVLRLLQSSDALLLTSVGMGEAAPVAVMEAMSCGLVVVCSVIGGTRDMITNGQDGFLVEQEDVDGITRCLQQMIESPETARSLGLAARARAVQNFDSQALAGQLLDLISEKTGRARNVPQPESGSDHNPTVTGRTTPF